MSVKLGRPSDQVGGSLLILLPVLVFIACGERAEWGSATLGIRCGGLDSFLPAGGPAIVLELGAEAVRRHGRLTIQRAEISDLGVFEPPGVQPAGGESAAGGFGAAISIANGGTATCRGPGGTIHVRLAVPVEAGTLRVAASRSVRIFARTDEDSVVAQMRFDPATDLTSSIEWGDRE